MWVEGSTQLVYSVSSPSSSSSSFERFTFWLGRDHQPTCLSIIAFGLEHKVEAFSWLNYFRARLSPHFHSNRYGTTTTASTPERIVWRKLCGNQTTQHTTTSHGPSNFAFITVASPTTTTSFFAFPSTNPWLKVCSSHKTMRNVAHTHTHLR